MGVRREEILEVVGLQLGVRAVKPSDHLLEDLGADSADLLNIVVALEDRLGITINEEEISRLGTVEDLLVLVTGPR